MTARYVSFTWWKTYTCHLEFGIIYANVPNAKSYSFYFNLKGYGPQKLVDVQPSAASDQLLALGNVPHAGMHFVELGGNGTGGTPKSSCITPTENGYSAQYSKLRVTAETAGKAPPKSKASLKVTITVPTSADETVAAMKVGEVDVVTVKVTASGASFKDVSLSGGGLVVYSAECGTKGHQTLIEAVTVTDAPATASGFPLAKGQTRTFKFKVRGRHNGPAGLKVTARGETTDGSTANASAKATIRVGTFLSRAFPDETPSCRMSFSADAVNPVVGPGG